MSSRELARKAGSGGLILIGGGFHGMYLIINKRLINKLLLTWLKVIFNKFKKKYNFKS